MSYGFRQCSAIEAIPSFLHQIKIPKRGCLSEFPLTEVDETDLKSTFLIFIPDQGNRAGADLSCIYGLLRQLNVGFCSSTAQQRDSLWPKIPKSVPCTRPDSCSPTTAIAVHRTVFSTGCSFTNDLPALNVCETVVRNAPTLPRPKTPIHSSFKRPPWRIAAKHVCELNHDDTKSSETEISQFDSSIERSSVAENGAARPV